MFAVYLKDPKSDKTTQIRLRIYIKGRPHHYNTGETILPAAWDFETQQCKTGKKYPLGENTNLRINRVIRQAGLVKSRFDTDNAKPSWQEFKMALDIALEKVQKPSVDFWTYVNELIERRARTTSNAHRWVINQRQTVRLLHEFEKGRATLSFDGFDQPWYDRFVAYCRKVKGYKENNIGKHIRHLKTWLNAATEEGINTSMLYKRFVKLTERTDEIFLSAPEIEKFIALDLEGTDAVVRDIFVFACYTGLRYVDYAQVKKKNIHGRSLHIYQSKTGNPVIIPLRPECWAVLERYGGELPKLPPNQVMNRYLKRLAVLSGIDKSKCDKVKTHTARRSFATNLYLEGFPSHDIMKITGHKTEKSFLLYIRTASADTARRLEQFWGLK